MDRFNTVFGVVQNGALVGRDAVVVAHGRTPARHLLDFDHSLLGDPQAADVIPLCLNG